MNYFTFFNIRQKTIYVIFLLLITTNSLFAQFKYSVDTNVVLIDGELSPFKTLIPGDTIRLKSGLRKLLILRNIHGNTEKPIIIINEKGLVDFTSNHYFGISIRHCSDIRLSGSGDPSLKYGIRIYNIQGTALSVGDYSTDFELDHIEIGNSLYSGITAKTEPDCDFQRNSFIQKNTVIHDCYITHSGTEGMYIGSSFYNGQTLNCKGGQKVVLPGLLSGVKIYNNYIEYSGWDGIQVSSAINAEIFNNKIFYDSQQQIDWQMTGIILGEGSTGSIYNNLIKDGEGTGIFTNGLGDIKIYNNIILDPGKNNEKSSSNYGIYIDDKSSINGMYFSVYNNLILNPNKQGIRLLNNLSSLKNMISNNIIIKNGMINSSKDPESEFLVVSENPAIIKSNYYSTNSSELFFEDELKLNFRLKSPSPLVDAGTKIVDVNFIKDYYSQPREQGFGIDIGPVESPYSRSVNLMNGSQLIKDLVFPNPVSSEEYFTIEFSNDLPGIINFNLVDNKGSLLKKLYSNYFINGNHMVSFETTNLTEGLNFIQIDKIRNGNLIRIVRKNEVR